MKRSTRLANMKIAQIKKQATRQRDMLSKSKKKSIAQMWELAEEFKKIAQTKGFLRANVQEHNDYPVVVIKRGMFVFFEPKAYVFEMNGSSRKYYNWGDLISRLNLEQGSFGNEENMMGDR